MISLKKGGCRMACTFSVGNHVFVSLRLMTTTHSANILINHSCTMFALNHGCILTLSLFHLDWIKIKMHFWEQSISWGMVNFCPMIKTCINNANVWLYTHMKTFQFCDGCIFVINGICWLISFSEWWVMKQMSLLQGLKTKWKALNNPTVLSHLKEGRVWPYC